MHKSPVGPLSIKGRNPAQTDQGGTTKDDTPRTNPVNTKPEADPSPKKDTKGGALSAAVAAKDGPDAEKRTILNRAALSARGLDAAEELEKLRNAAIARVGKVLRKSQKDPPSISFWASVSRISRGSCRKTTAKAHRFATAEPQSRNEGSTFGYSGTVSRAVQGRAAVYCGNFESPAASSTRCRFSECVESST